MCHSSKPMLVKVCLMLYLSCFSSFLECLPPLQFGGEMW